MRIVEIYTEKPVDVSDNDYFQALGRLSSWASERFPFVRIHQDGRSDLTASYFDTAEGGKPNYVIGAVWSGSEYSFHS